MPISIAILVSGRGSNMQSILEAIKDGRLEASTSVVVSNNADAPALSIARDYGVKAVAVPHRGLSREQHEDALLAELRKYSFEYVVLAGYMRVLTPRFLKEFRHPDGYFKVINIHPSLLPEFPGAHGYEEAFEQNVPMSGITIHLVDEQVDHGPILAQETFPRLPDDTLETFKARGLALEHQLYPRVLQSLSQHGVRFKAVKTGGVQ
jgi:formyltetrahydrofolate-dependent phosphoribosylglycinamide formyltransferase